MIALTRTYFAVQPLQQPLQVRERSQSTARKIWNATDQSMDTNTCSAARTHQLVHNFNTWKAEGDDFVCSIRAGMTDLGLNRCLAVNCGRIAKYSKLTIADCQN
jgi:hypothetical protein